MSNKDSGKIIVSYARALAEATEQGDLALMQQALNLLSDTWLNNIELRSALLNPAIALATREQIIADICKSCSANNAAIVSRLTNFSYLLLQNNRIELLADIAKQFNVYLAVLKNILAVNITSAVQLAENEKEQLTKQLKDSCGELTTINWQVDPELIGGLLVQAGDKVLDNTVRGSLQQLRENLLQ